MQQSRVEHRSDAVLEKVAILGCTQLYRSLLLCPSQSSWINYLTLTLIVVATYLPPSLPLSRDEPASHPANKAVNQPLMLQRVWLSPNPPWLTLAIIQSGLQLTGYIMINQSHPGSRRICSYGNRQRPSFAFSPKECKPSPNLHILFKITDKYEEKGAVTVICLGLTLRSIIVPIHS